MMKILMLNFGRKNEGTFYRAYAWAKYLVKEGHEVTIVCVSRNRKFRSEVTYDHGIRILETPNFLDGNRVMVRFSGTTGWGVFDIILRLQEILRDNYDIVHTFEHFPNVFIPTCVAPKGKIPLLISDWCDHFGEGGFREDYCSPYRLNFIYKRIGFPIRRIMDFVERYHRVRATAVTVISKYLFKRAEDIGINGGNIFLIPGSVDINQLQPIDKAVAKDKVGFNREKQIVTFLGSAQFDVDFALDAFSLVLKDNPDVSFMIIGKEDDIIQRKVSELNIKNNVIITGRCPDELLPLYLSASDAFLLPMRNNPVNQARWPNKIGEYMASGKPTICTAVGDVANLIENEEIGLVSEDNYRDFAKKILMILNNKELSLKMGDRALKLAETKFALEVQGAKLEDIYQSLIYLHGDDKKNATRN